MSEQPVSHRFRLFAPILVGANLRDRLFACAGAAIGICLTGLITALATGHGALLPLLAAPLGASTVLVFVLPASPISQPWPVIGGNTISALSGVAAMQLVRDPALACGLAVGLAIALMSLTRSLHPPGGGMALTTVVGGSSIAASGFAFALVPVCLNSILLVALAWMFHRLARRAYPHAAAPPARERIDANLDVRGEDIEIAIAQLGETLDIDRRDLDRLLLLAQHNARARNAASAKPD
jgi:CBS domain-containing membrane protein